MNRFLDAFNRILGPGHIGKAELDADQKVFHWPFVTLTQEGRGKWALDVYFEPNFPRSSTAKLPTIHLSLMPRAEALRRAIEENRLAAEKWAQSQRQKRKEEHDASLKNKEGEHTGHYTTCPVCIAQKKPRRRF